MCRAHCAILYGLLYHWVFRSGQREAHSMSTTPAILQSARILVISDFNCPYCFTLNEWLRELGVDHHHQVRWVGVEHKPLLPTDPTGDNTATDIEILGRETTDVIARAPEVRLHRPRTWLNSRRALLVQAAIEDDFPEKASALRTAIFRSFWHKGRNFAAEDTLDALLAEQGLAPVSGQFLDEITTWWRQELDRIPCMLAPTGARHLGLQTREQVRAFVTGALHEPPATGAFCR